MPKKGKLLGFVGALSFLVISATSPTFSAGAKRTPAQLKSPIGIVVTPVAPGGDFTVSWQTDPKASSYTVRVYSDTGKASSVINDAISGLSVTRTQSMIYRVTVQAIGNGTTFANSPESGKYGVTTYQATYNILWDEQGGVSGTAGPSSYITGQSIGSLPVTTTKTGHTFDGWYDNSGLTGSAIDGTYTPGSPYGAVTFYAKWAAVNINWNHTGGVSVTPGPSNYEEGQSIGSLPVTTTKAGHTFDGWYDNSGLTGSAIDGTYTPDSPYGTVTFYAKWNPIRPVCGENGVRTSGGVGACQISDIGPGGGIIFLLPSSEYNSTGKYFEFAGANAGSDRYGLCSAFVSVGTSWGIGQGENNTELLLANNLCSAPNYPASAASVASNYTSNGFNDWYLPSFNELVQAKLKLATSVAEAALLGITVSDSEKYFGDYDYLASAEYSANSSGWVDFGIYTQSQPSLFNCGANWVDPPVSGWPRCSDYKPGLHFVRAVRSAYFSTEPFTTAPTPTVCASPQLGAECAAMIGTWSPSASLSYQWQVSDDGSDPWTDVVDATATSYTPVSGDEAKFLRIKVTGTLAGYTTTTMTSLASTAVAAAVPSSLITTGDFTIQMWVKPTADFNNGARHELFAITPENNTARLDIWYEGGWTLFDSKNLSFNSFAGTGSAPVIGQWYNIVLTRSSGVMHVFFNGVKQLDYSAGAAADDLTGYKKIWLGEDPGGGNGSGNALLAHLRIVDGQDLFPSNFTPDVTPPTAITGTTFLLQDVIPSSWQPGASLVLGPGGPQNTTSSYFRFIFGVDTRLQQWTNGALGVAESSSESPTRIGSTGPGGGIIFYYDSAGFTCGAIAVGVVTSPKTPTTCHYLEVAPSSWSTLEETGFPWSVTDYGNTDIAEITNDTSAYNNAAAIGLGLQNSLYIVAQGNGNTTAAGAAREYIGNSLTDWYLPTTAELNLLCQWNFGLPQLVATRCAGGTINSGIGASQAGFLEEGYFSSSESSYWKAWYQIFSNGSQGLGTKVLAGCVRPIRAF